MQDWHDMWPGNEVHQTAIIDPSVEMGKGNYIGPYTIIGPDVTMGDGNRFEGHCSIGSPPEHKDHFKGRSARGVLIGDWNVFREFTTVNAGTTRQTQIGSQCIMLRGSHHSHDSIMEDMVTLSCNVLVGGHSHIMQGANLGLGVILHQYSMIGSYAMLGMGTIVTRDQVIRPGWTYVGAPARPLHINTVGLERAHITRGILASLEAKYYTMRGSNKP